VYEAAASEEHFAFRGLAISLLASKEHSLRGLIVFAFPQESTCFSCAVAGAIHRFTRQQ